MSASPVPKDWDQLIAKARSGDWRAEELLFKDSKRILWATYRRNNGQWGMPEDDAESLMHLSIARAMNKYPGGYYPAYLKTTFINGVIGEWIRKRHADLEPIYIPDGETEEERPQKELAASTDVLAEVLARNEWRIVFDCMSKLPPARRESLQLSLEGWSYEQIAQRVREKSIKDLIYRAKQDVQKCFEERTGMKP